jgi:hypothetical protein
MKLIIKNDNRDIVKNPNVKIIETTKDSFTDQTVFVEENDITIIKYTDTGSIYFVKDLDNLYDRKSKSEVLINISSENLELIGDGGSSTPSYKVYTALLTQTGTDAPVATVLENTLGEITYSYAGVGKYSIISSGLFLTNKTVVFFGDIVNNASGGLLITTIQGEDVNSNTLPFYTNVDGTDTNSALLKTPIEIRVYN